MSQAWITTIGAILAALLGGGIAKALVDFARDRRDGRLANIAFEFKTLGDMNDRQREQIARLASEMEDERKRRTAELEEERAKRRALEDDLARERRRTAALESRVEELERHRGNSS